MESTVTAQKQVEQYIRKIAEIVAQMNDLQREAFRAWMKENL